MLASAAAMVSASLLPPLKAEQTRRTGRSAGRIDYSSEAVCLSDFEALREQFERKWGFAMWDWGSRMQQGVIHFHVWTQGEMIDLLKHVGLTILYVVDYVPERPDSFVVIARK